MVQKWEGKRNKVREWDGKGNKRFGLEQCREYKQIMWQHIYALKWWYFPNK